MSTSNLRRRLHHGDVDGRKNEHVDISSVDSLNEPLLGKSSYDNGGLEAYNPRRQDLWDDDRKKEQLHWSFLFSNLIAQWAQWLGFLSDASEQSTRAESRLGVPFCSCWYQHFIHADPDVGSTVICSIFKVRNTFPGATQMR